MTVFADTSALYALLDRDDEGHRRAARGWERLLSADERLVSTNYIVVECAALLQHRFGMEAVRVFFEDILPVVHLEWVDRDTHDAAEGAWRTAARRSLSFVDCVSFEVMRRLGARKAFTLDTHFRQHGFSCLP